MREIDVHNWREDARDDAANQPEGSSGQEQAGRVLALLASNVLLVEALRDSRAWMVRTARPKPQGDATQARAYREKQRALYSEQERVRRAIDEALKPYDEEVER